MASKKQPKKKPVQLGTPSPEISDKVKELKKRLAGESGEPTKKAAAKKQPAQPKTSREKALANAAKEVRAERKRTKDSVNLAPKAEPEQTAPKTKLQLVDPERLSREAEARDKIAEDQENLGDLQAKNALKLAENDFGRQVDEPDEEDQGISGASDTARMLQQTENEAQSFINRGSDDPAANPVLDRPRPESATQREARLKDRAAAARVTGARRREDAINAITPTVGPPVLRHVIGRDEDPADFGLTEDQVVRGDPDKVGTVTAVRPNRGASVPLNENELVNAQQFWGFERRGEDTRPESIFDVVDDKIVGYKGLPETNRPSATVKSQENAVVRARGSVENDIKLAQDLLEVGKAIPETVTESTEPTLVGGSSSVRADVKDTSVRPGTAADIDPNSPAGARLRGIAAETVSGFGEIGRAGQKRPGGYGATAPGVKPKQTSDTTTEAGRAAAFFRRTLSGGQFQDLHDFIKSASGELETMPSEWDPSMGLPSAEGYDYAPIIGEGPAREVAEAGAAGSDSRRRSVPVVTSPQVAEEDLPDNMQTLLQLVNSSWFTPDELNTLKDQIRSPRSRLRSQNVETAPAVGYSGPTSEEDQQRMRDVADQPGSPATIRDSYKGMRRSVDEPSVGRGTTDKALRLSGGSVGGLRSNIADMMQRYLGRGGGSRQRGAAVGSESGEALAMEVTKNRPGRSVRVTLANDSQGNPLPEPKTQSVPTGQPLYTDKEIGQLQKVNPELADIVNPTSDFNTARSGRMTEEGMELARAGEQVPDDQITWEGPLGVPNPKARLQGTDASGAPAATRATVVKEGAKRTVVRAAQRGVAAPDTPNTVPAPPKYDTKSGSYFPLTQAQSASVSRRLRQKLGVYDAPIQEGSAPEQVDVLEPIDQPIAPLGTVYLGSQFRPSRVVEPGAQSGLIVNADNNAVITNPERLAATPAGRRALNEPLRTRQIAEAKRVSNQTKNALTPEDIAANAEFDRRHTLRRITDATEAAVQRRVSAPINAEAERFGRGPTVASTSRGAEAPSPFTASRQGMFIQPPSVEREINPIGAHLLGAYSSYSGKDWTEERPPVGNEKAQAETLTGRVREMTGNQIANAVNPYATSSQNMFKPKADTQAAPFRGAQNGRLSHFGTSIFGSEGSNWQESIRTPQEKSMDSLSKASVGEDDVEGQQVGSGQAIGRGWKKSKKSKK